MYNCIELSIIFDPFSRFCIYIYSVIITESDPK